MQSGKKVDLSVEEQVIGFLPSMDYLMSYVRAPLTGTPDEARQKVEKIKPLLDKISIEIAANDLPIEAFPCFYYFILQVSRYNGEFNTSAQPHGCSAIDHALIRNTQKAELEDIVRLFTPMLRAFIEKLRAQEGIHRLEILSKVRNMEFLVGCIGKWLELQDANTVDNVHLNYFLLTVSQYNALFLTVCETGKSMQPNELFEYLRVRELKPVIHALLGGAANVELNYKRKKTQRFTDATVREGKYFYDAMQPVNGFVRDYRRAMAELQRKTTSTDIKANFAKLFSGGQLADNFWRREDVLSQIYQKRIGREALRRIAEGEVLSADHLKLLKEGELYRGTGSSLEYSSIPDLVGKFKPKHFHVGDGTQVLDMGFVTVVVDPVNGKHSSGAKRHVEPGIRAQDYFTHIVLITHADQVCERTLCAAWSGLNPLFVVPAGVDKKLAAWGFKHVIAFTSWNDELAVRVADNDGRNFGR